MKDLIIISDVGLDTDDEFTLLFASCLHKHNLINLKAIIANTAPSYYRAQLAKGTLELLNLDIPVGIGKSAGQNFIYNDSEFKVDYLSSNLEDGYTLLYNTLINAEDNSLNILLISALSDINFLIKNNYDLIKQKVKSFYIMGGIKEYNDKGLYPDLSANNVFDCQASLEFYSSLKELEIDTTIINRHAIYEIPFDKEFYSSLNNHVIGKRLYKRTKETLEEYYKSTFKELKNPRHTTEWFLNTFCDINSEIDNYRINTDIWDDIKNFYLYDPITLAALVYPQYFKAQQLNEFPFINIIGDPNNSSLNNPKDLKNLIESHIIEVLNDEK